MSNYKFIRAEERVYLDLQARQLPRESMSETIERILRDYDEALGYAQALLETLQGGK